MTQLCINCHQRARNTARNNAKYGLCDSCYYDLIEKKEVCVACGFSSDIVNNLCFSCRKLYDIDMNILKIEQQYTVGEPSAIIQAKIKNMTFANFRGTKNNEKAMQKASQFANGHIKGLWLFSDNYGNGKTHLLFAAMFESLKKYKKCYYINTKIFIEKIIAKKSQYRSIEQTFLDELKILPLLKQDYIFWDEIITESSSILNLKLYFRLLCNFLGTICLNDKPRIFCVSNKKLNYLSGKIDGDVYSRLKALFDTFIINEEKTDWRINAKNKV
jgi:DNA replication protein DnaC